jgi:hypothetical protein
MKPTSRPCTPINQQFAHTHYHILQKASVLTTFALLIHAMAESLSCTKHRIFSYFVNNLQIYEMRKKNGRLHIFVSTYISSSYKHVFIYMIII